MTDLALTPLTALLIAVAGGFGAVCRYSLDRLVMRRGPSGPVGIFVVNTTASALLGVLAGLGLTGAEALTGAGTLVPGADVVGQVLATGLLGGFSTFSTVAVDSAKLLRARQWGWFATNTLGMLLMTMGACAGAHALTSALSA